MAAAKPDGSEVRAAIRVGRQPGLDVRGRPAGEPALRGEGRARLRDAVVGPGRAQPAGVPGVGRRHPPRQVVRLGARVDEEDGVEIRWTGRDQPFRELDRGLVEVAHVRVEEPCLSGRGFGDARVAMPDARDVVVGIQVAAAVGVRHPDAARAGQVDRVLIRQRFEGGAQHGLAARGQVGVGRVARRAAETSGRLVPSGVEDRPDDRLSGRRVALGELGVLEPARRAPGRDGDRHRGSGGDEFAHQSELHGFQRRQSLVAVQHQARDPEELVGVAAVRQRIDDGCDVDRHRRVAHVAEVDDAGDPPVVVDEGVVDGEVRVDDLRPQERPGRDDHGFEAIQNGGDGGTATRVADVVEHRTRPRGVLDIPEHRPVRAGMGEASEGSSESRRHLAPVGDGGIRERQRVASAAARQDVVQADEMRLRQRRGCRRARSRGRRRPHLVPDPLPARPWAGRRGVPDRRVGRAGRRAPPCRGSRAPRPRWRSS